MHRGLKEAPPASASFPSRPRAASEERGRRPAALRSQEFLPFASCCILLSYTRRVLMAKPLRSPPTSVCCQSFFFFLFFYGFCLSTEPPADPTSRRLRAAINPRSSQEFLPPRWLDMCRALLLTEVPPSLSFCFLCSSSLHSGVSSVDGVCERTPLPVSSTGPQQ